MHINSKIERKSDNCCTSIMYSFFLSSFPDCECLRTCMHPCMHALAFDNFFSWSWDHDCSLRTPMCPLCQCLKGLWLWDHEFLCCPYVCLWARGYEILNSYGVLMFVLWARAFFFFLILFFFFFSFSFLFFPFSKTSSPFPSPRVVPENWSDYESEVNDRLWF